MSQISVRFVTRFAHYRFLTSKHFSCLECKPQLFNTKTRMLNHSLPYYIINIKNSLVSRKSLIFSMYVTSHLKTHIFFQQNQVYLSYFLQLSVVTFTNFLTKGIFIKISVTILDCSNIQLYVTSHLEWMVLTNLVYRDQQLVYVAYLRTSILDVRTLRCTLVFTLRFFYDFHIA